jgi:ribosomal protein S18 acetylase RimI-like enzyme
MSFHVVETETEEDLDFFFKLSYETLKTLRKNMYDKLVEENPGKSDEELQKLNRNEMEDYFDFSDSTSRVFIVKQEDSMRCGYLWMGLRNSRDPWDIQKPQWIYDLVVVPEFQRNGLGKMLMMTAEEFSRELNLNIGLFVHAENENARSLYDKIGYSVKTIPISKKLNQEIVDSDISSKFLVRTEQKTDDVRKSELDRFKKKVLFSLEAEDTKIRGMYEDYFSNYIDNSENHVRLEAVTDDETLVGSIWAGVSGFSESVAQIYNLSIISESSNDEVGKALIQSVEKWAKDSGYSTLYILLHSQDDMSVKAFKSLGYSIPGFFMEKKLTQ